MIAVIPDSLLIATPWLPVTVSSDALLGFWGQVFAGVLIPVVVWILARGRLRSERWHERQQGVYHAIADHLYVVQEFTGYQAEEEGRLERLDEQDVP